LTFDECIWNNLKTEGQGGIVYGDVVDFQKLGSSILCELSNITAEGGSAFFASTQSGIDFVLSGCELGCNDAFESGTVDSELADDLVSSGGRLFEFTGGTVEFEDMTIKNCYVADQGGVIKMNGGSFKDTDSTYKNNAAEEGGVFYCDACNLELYGTIFLEDYAKHGGGIYSNEGSTIELHGITVTDLRAYEAGGFIYAVATTGVAATINF
jgi:hypothetical protein